MSSTRRKSSSAVAASSGRMSNTMPVTAGQQHIQQQQQYQHSHTTSANSSVIMSSSSDYGDILGSSSGTDADNNDSSLIDRFRVSSNPNPPAQKLVVGSQYRMPQRLPQPCEQCDSLNNSLRKAKETIRGLKLQIARLEERLRESSKTTKVVPDPATNSSDTADFDTLKQQYNALCRKAREYEAEIVKLRKLIADEAAANEENKRAMSRTNQLLNEEILKLQEELQILREKYSVSVEERRVQGAIIVELEDGSRKKDERIAALEAELEALRNSKGSGVSEEELQKLRTEVANQKDVIFSLKKAVSKAVEEKDAQFVSFTAQVNSLNDQVKGLTDEVATKDTILAERNMSIEKLSYRAQELEDVVKEGEANLAQSKAQTKDAVKRNHELTSNLEEKCAAYDILNQKYNDLIAKMTKESELTTKALEKAISSSVRLCVVAPTVNVHIADKKLKMQSKTSEGELRDFLTNSVLSKYVHMYNQENDDMAPDGKTPLRVWVGKMLNEMQESIEGHINNAMKGSGGGGGGGGSAAASARRGSRGSNASGSGSEREA